MKIDSVLTLVFIIIGLAMLLFSFWNFTTLRRLSDQRRLPDIQLNDSKYFELKYKQEFLLAVFSIVIGVLIFVGYDSYKSLKENLQSNIEREIQPTTEKIRSINDSIGDQQNRITTLTTDIASKSTSLEQLNKLVANLNKEQATLKSKIATSKENVSDYQTSILDITRRISEIKNKNIIKQELYLIKDIEYTYPLDYWEYKSFEFKDMQTVNGEKLPVFKDPPIIIPFSNDGLSYATKDITTTSFKIIPFNNTLPDLPKKYFFTLMISVIE